MLDLFLEPETSKEVKRKKKMKEILTEEEENYLDLTFTCHVQDYQNSRGRT